MHPIKKMYESTTTTGIIGSIALEGIVRGAKNYIEIPLLITGTYFAPEATEFIKNQFSTSPETAETIKNVALIYAPHILGPAIEYANTYLKVRHNNGFPKNYARMHAIKNTTLRIMRNNLITPQGVNTASKILSISLGTLIDTYKIHCKRKLKIS